MKRHEDFPHLPNHTAALVCQSPGGSFRKPCHIHAEVLQSSPGGSPRPGSSETPALLVPTQARAQFQWVALGLADAGTARVLLLFSRATVWASRPRIPAALFHVPSPLPTEAIFPNDCMSQREEINTRASDSSGLETNTKSFCNGESFPK